MDPLVIEVRREVCAVSCAEQCAAYRAGRIDHGDAKASCPRAGWILAWGCYGPCDGPTPPVPAPPIRPPPLPEPTLADLAGRAAFAAWRATVAKAHGERLLVTPAEYAARTAACEACPLWDGHARFGWGKCKHPGCGCTKLKRWLTTERCPLAKWPEAPALTPSVPQSPGV